MGSLEQPGFTIVTPKKQPMHRCHGNMIGPTGTSHIFVSAAHLEGGGFKWNPETFSLTVHPLILSEIEAAVPASVVLITTRYYVSLIDAANSAGNPEIFMRERAYGTMPRWCYTLDPQRFSVERGRWAIAWAYKEFKNALGFPGRKLIPEISVAWINYWTALEQQESRKVIAQEEVEAKSLLQEWLRVLNQSRGNLYQDVSELTALLNNPFDAVVKIAKSETRLDLADIQSRLLDAMPQHLRAASLGELQAAIKKEFEDQYVLLGCPIEEEFKRLFPGTVKQAELVTVQ